MSEYLSPNGFRGPVLSGWGIFFFIPLAVLFPALILPLLLSVSFLLREGRIGAPVRVLTARTAFPAFDAPSLRGPPRV